MADYFYEVQAQPIAQITPEVINFEDITDWRKVIPAGFSTIGKKKQGVWYHDPRRTRQLQANKKKDQKTGSVYTTRIPLAFDIETYTNVKKTTRIYKGKEVEEIESAYAYMYIWQFFIGDPHKGQSKVVIGRTWEQFVILLDQLSSILGLGSHYNANRKAAEYYEAKIFVANLSYEFQFMRHLLDIDSVFAKNKRQPLTVVTKNGLYFQDALAITNTSLAKIPKTYNLPTQKLEGDLDYTIPRNSKTILTPTELQYCVNDVTILAEFYSWLITNYVDNGLFIPLTATGKLRHGVKADAQDWAVAGSGRHGKYYDPIKIKALTDLMPKNVLDAEITREFLFSGGYTHCNYFQAGITLTNENVNGIDFTSSYPAVMLQKNFPMTKFTKYTETEGWYREPTKEEIFNNTKNGYASKMWIRIRNITPKTPHSIISCSKIWEYKKECGSSLSRFILEHGAIVDNGRLLEADQITMYITDVDLAILDLYYNIDDYEIRNAQWSMYGKLPKYIRKHIIINYQAKNVLKKQDLEESTEYKLAKEMVNAGYGFMVEHNHLIDYRYDVESDEWTDNAKEVSKAFREGDKEGKVQMAYDNEMLGNVKSVEACRKMPKRVASPYWGIWVTAWARYNLLVNLIEFGEDAIYCDTDSIYTKNFDKHRAVIDKWNNHIYKLNETWVDEWNQTKPYGIAVDIEHFRDLGEFDIINKLGNYSRFKTLGAKRYLKEGPKKNKKTKQIETVIEQTIAGLPKTALIDHCKKNSLDPFEFFNDQMCIKECKNAHAYNDTPHSEYITDTQGNTVLMSEDSSVGIFPIDFSMSLASEYAELIATKPNINARFNLFTGEHDIYA